MKLQEIYDQMVHGEASNLFLGKRNREDTEFRREDLPKVLSMVRSALTDLHTRMNLRERQELVTLVDAQAEYVLTPTNDDLLQITSIKGTLMDEEFDIPLDDEMDAGSIRRTAYNSFRVPLDEDDAPWLTETGDLVVTYRANHPAISAPRANASPGIVDIDLPRSHLNALIWFMASRLHNPVGMKNEFHAGNNYQLKYENEIVRLSGLGMDIDTTPSASHFERSGMP